MRQAIGVMAPKEVLVGVVEESRIAGPLHIYPERGGEGEGLAGVPADEIVDRLRDQILLAAQGRDIAAVGVGFPGIISDGVVEESPNLQQIKGLRLRELLAGALARSGFPVPVTVLNDADAVAAGIAATRGSLEKQIRAWYLGDGIGFGRYPRSEGVWEGGHMVVSLDPKERYCGCGGEGHLEGIMGRRAMRLRFLDMEPEEVFAGAKAGDERCHEFVRMWHRALAAASATSIHLEGSGKFYLTGPSAGFVDIALLSSFVHAMVKMSPLQGNLFEVVPTSDEIAVIGAAVSARREVAAE